MLSPKPETPSLPSSTPAPPPFLAAGFGRKSPLCRGERPVRSFPRAFSISPPSSLRPRRRFLEVLSSLPLDGAMGGGRTRRTRAFSCPSGVPCRRPRPGPDGVARRRRTPLTQKSYHSKEPLYRQIHIRLIPPPFPPSSSSIVECRRACVPPQSSKHQWDLFFSLLPFRGRGPALTSPSFPPPSPPPFRLPAHAHPPAASSAGKKSFRPERLRQAPSRCARS